jgi:hypothetical protein
MKSELIKKEVVEDVFVEKFPALYKTKNNIVVMFISARCGMCIHKEDSPCNSWFVGEIREGEHIISCYDKETFTRLESGEIVQLFND